MIPLPLFSDYEYPYASEIENQDPPWSSKNPHEGTKKFRNRKQNRQKSKKKNRK